jgi:Uma2 family endonuclease
VKVSEELLTADEFFVLPSPREGGKMELVRGKVVTMPPVGEGHGRLAVRVSVLLERFADENALGPVLVEAGFLIARDPDLVRAPDVSFVAAHRLERDRDRSRYIDGPPTLAVEIVSPWDLDTDVAAKVAEYLAAGTDRVWVVRPRPRTVTVHRPAGDSHAYGLGDTLTSDDAGFAVPGFSLALSDLFHA